jgi:N6-adenosine-specific RNA methylase IME4
MVWTKPQMGLGWWVRQQHEILLIGTKGTPATPLPADRPRSVLSAPRRRHSQKPDEMYHLIDRMFPHLTDRLEMFARNTRPGWTSWGNEVPSDTPEDPGEADTAVGQRKTGEGENT